MEYITEADRQHIDAIQAREEQDAANLLTDEETMSRIWSYKRSFRVSEKKGRSLRIVSNFEMSTGMTYNTIGILDENKNKVVVSYPCSHSFHKYCEVNPQMWRKWESLGRTFYTLIGEEFKELSPSQLFKKYPIDQDYYHATAKLKPGGKVTAEEMTTFFGKDKVKEVVYFVCRKHSATLVCTLKST